jgi:7-cyano-7-deazaguanine synthase
LSDADILQSGTLPSTSRPTDTMPSGAGRNRAIVCLSGGMDSTVCAALAARDFDAYGLHFSYGQRTEAREFESAQAVAAAVGLKDLLQVRTDFFRNIGGSALTDHSIAVPSAANHAESTPMSARRGDDVPVTYVPFRNAHFLAAAVSWAEVLGAQTVFIGAVEQDSSGYPDCRPAYYGAFNRLVHEGTKDGTIEIVTPLIHLHKREIVRLGVELGAPLHVSWSCYASDRAACGVCESCVLRLRAFAEAGVPDPAPYASFEVEGRAQTFPEGEDQ